MGKENIKKEEKVIIENKFTKEKYGCKFAIVLKGE